MDNDTRGMLNLLPIEERIRILREDLKYSEEEIGRCTLAVALTPDVAAFIEGMAAIYGWTFEGAIIKLLGAASAFLGSMQSTSLTVDLPH